MNLHIFSLCEHRARAPSDDGLDAVRLEGAPPQPADVNNDTPTPINWGDSVIEGEEIPVIAGSITCPSASRIACGSLSGHVTTAGKTRPTEIEISRTYSAIRR